MSYSIKPHGTNGEYILLLGQDNQHHGYNLCTLSNFDNNGEQLREAIVESLNDNVRLTKENTELTARLIYFEGLKNKIRGKDKSFLETLARQLHKRTYNQPFELMNDTEQSRAILDAEDFLAMIFQ